MKDFLNGVDDDDFLLPSARFRTDRAPVAKPPCLELD